MSPIQADDTEHIASGLTLKPSKARRPFHVKYRLRRHEKVKELERLHDVVIGRELKMMELEKEVAKLQKN